MESVKTAKTNKVGKNTETANTKASKRLILNKRAPLQIRSDQLVGFLQKLQRKLENL